VRTQEGDGGAAADRLEIWRFCPDPADGGESAGYAETSFDDRLWREVAVPVDYERCLPGLDTYEGVGWFRHRLDAPASWRGRRVSVHFAGVTTRADVWVNGTCVGACDAPYLPSTFDVQSLLRFDGSDLVAVRVDNRRRAGEVPGREWGWRNFGGITREVTLEVGDLCVVEELAVTAAPSAGGGRLSVDLQVMNRRMRPAALGLTSTVSDEDGTVLVSLARSDIPLEAEGSTRVTLTGDVPEAMPWSPDSPVLYTLDVTLHEAGRTLWARALHIGFRTIEVAGTQLLLNGEPTFLTGFNRHEDSPKTNQSPDLSLTRRDLEAMKAAGANFVRLCHYPHHPVELDLCDELGLMVMDEIPLYWWNGLEEGAEASVAKLSAAEEQLRRLIARDRNHPSVVLWSVSNETEEERPEVAEGNRHLVRVAKALDPSRLGVHVSNHWHEHPHFEEDDLLCVNAYPSFGAIVSERRQDYDLAASTEAWRSDLARLHEAEPEKPVLVTEFGFASLLGAAGGAFSGRLHADAMEAEFSGMDASYVCGATVWCWADHAWPPAHFDFCGSLGVSPYGVVTRDRRPKPALDRIAALLGRRQGIPALALHVGPRRGPSGLEVYMVRRDLDAVPVLPWPDGFAVRTYRPGDAGLWTDIWSEADPFGPMDPGMFFQAFGDDLPALERRCYFVENEAGAAVATIASWYNRTYHGDDYGQIHWVATRKPYWGRGIGKAMLSHALVEMGQWHDKAFLGTQTLRLPAIKLYLDLGFVPDLDYPGAREAWREVKAALQHPVLEALDLQ